MWSYVLSALTRGQDPLTPPLVTDNFGDFSFSEMLFRWNFVAPFYLVDENKWFQKCLEKNSVKKISFFIIFIFFVKPFLTRNYFDGNRKKRI